MELSNDFRVSVPPETAWKVLTDVERIAPMLPGAQLQEVEGDEYRGIVKVKVGPITAQYKGTASFQERDQEAGRAVLKATGRDTRGQGNASATITATLAADGDGTRVSVVTDLTVTGKVAQFGRGVLADVSSKLIGQFVDALEADLQRGGEPATPAPAPASAPSAEPPAGPAAAAPATPAPPATPSSTTPAAPAAGPTPDTSAAATDGTLLDGQERGAGVDGETGGPSERPAVRRIEAPEAKPVDLLEAAGGSVAKRLLPVLGVLGVLLVVILLRRSRKR